MELPHTHHLRFRFVTLDASSVTLDFSALNLTWHRPVVPQIMYLRYGRAQLDYQLEEVFGTSDLNSGKLLTLTEFLHCLHASQVKQLLNRCGSCSNRDSVAAVHPGVPPRVHERLQCGMRDAAAASRLVSGR